jgi:hypothetical protein
LSGAGKDTNPWADLVIAILSVNNYPLEKTFALFNSLEESGLFDPGSLAAFSSGDIARKLGAAGYDRGDTMTAIFTDRLISLGQLTASTPVETATRVLRTGGREEVSSLLSGVKGIGPKVLANFFLLRGDARHAPANRRVSR